jgi:hypothetical protein
VETTSLVSTAGVILALGVGAYFAVVFGWKLYDTGPAPAPKPAPMPPPSARQTPTPPRRVIITPPPKVEMPAPPTPPPVAAAPSPPAERPPRPHPSPPPAPAAMSSQPASPPPPPPQQAPTLDFSRWQSLPAWLTEDPPQAYRTALDAGDCALGEGLLTGAAVWYAQAFAIANGEPKKREWAYYAAKAASRVEALCAICLDGVGGLRSSRGEDDRWNALLTLAEQDALRISPTSTLQLASRVRAPQPGDAAAMEASERAWTILLACPFLPKGLFQQIDWELVIEGLHDRRARLALHPSATPDVWLGMLTRARTPDLVHTLWETPRATADQRVRTALGTLAGSGPKSDADG